MKHLSPKETQAYLQQRPEALFLDIRMELEYLYVGHPPGVVHVAWYEYPEMQADEAGFVAQVRREAEDQLNRPVVLICRSGQRTVKAGEALEAAGFTEVVNVLHGFEGDLDANFQRGRLNGWRFDGLPWEQM
ncbi:rhodanese-like domain-containing protein [Pelomonas sp. SE-A7]|uniref:rhodanese-like domain-containing protein n=1 Tax=Pelomonas sp. SE-A7 TaxID=3054953 RepID=UPI00259CE4C3|nr:rhodanese-like domain-containing protein [Pelomonas sp. SE-A7]MDM4768251.1 rhodanese-like domain-containing protein [Pelomonas sp. SE-A7]